MEAAELFVKCLENKLPRGLHREREAHPETRKASVSGLKML